METPVAVLAGTPVDTQMGAVFVKQAGLLACPFPLAADPRSQTAFQISSYAEKMQTSVTCWPKRKPRAAGVCLSTAIPSLPP